MIVALDGAVLVPDPSYCIMSNFEGGRATPEQPGCFVYRVDVASGAVERKIRTMRMPNGLAFSPDERTLHIADSSRSHVNAGHNRALAFSVNDDRRLGGPRVFATIADGVPDGLRVDGSNKVWLSSGRGIEIFAGDGTALGTLFVPKAVANPSFGGPKNNRLFIAATTSV